MVHESSRPGLEGRGSHYRSRSRSMSPAVRSRSDHRDRRRNRERSYIANDNRDSRTPDDTNQHYHKADTKSRDSRHHHHHHHRRRDERGDSDRRRKDLSPVSAAPPVLPYNARQLSKRDLPQFEPMFAMYLDIQKGLILEDLDEKEMKGRWKSFVKRWNRGELAEGWYDPSTFEKASSTFKGERISDSGSLVAREAKESERSDDDGMEELPEDKPLQKEKIAEVNDNDDDDDDENYGPKLPNQIVSSRNYRSGPTIPKLQDLELQRESALEDARIARSTALVEYKEEFRSHKDHLRTIEDEVAPRAEPGTRERKMEKRREAAAANREFAAGRRGGSPAMDAAPDEELMGGGDNDLEALKKAREQEKKKKNERERRREELLRARKAEREERLAEYRKKEEETMGWLKALAKQRFG